MREWADNTKLDEENVPSPTPLSPDSTSNALKFFRYERNSAPNTLSAYRRTQKAYNFDDFFIRSTFIS